MSSLFYFFRVRSVYFLMEKFHKIFFLYVSFLLLTTLLWWNEIIFSVCFCCVLLPMSPRCPISCSSSSSPSHRMKGFALSQPFPTSVCSLSVSRLPLFFSHHQKTSTSLFLWFFMFLLPLFISFSSLLLLFPIFHDPFNCIKEKQRARQKAFISWSSAIVPPARLSLFMILFPRSFSAHLNLLQF